MLVVQLKKIITSVLKLTYTRSRLKHNIFIPLIIYINHKQYQQGVKN